MADCEVCGNAKHIEVRSSGDRWDWACRTCKLAAQTKLQPRHKRRLVTLKNPGPIQIVETYKDLPATGHVGDIRIVRDAKSRYVMAGDNAFNDWVLAGTATAEELLGSLTGNDKMDAQNDRRAALTATAEKHTADLDEGISVEEAIAEWMPSGNFGPMEDSDANNGLKEALDKAGVTPAGMTRDNRTALELQAELNARAKWDAEKQTSRERHKLKQKRWQSYTEECAACGNNRSHLVGYVYQARTKEGTTVYFCDENCYEEFEQKLDGRTPDEAISGKSDRQLALESTARKQAEREQS